MATTLEYNGVAFNSLYSTSVTSRPVLDEASRSVSYVEHTLSVVGIVAEDSPVTSGGIMELNRKSLTSVAGRLQFDDHGWGTVDINGSATSRDAAWGPIPEMLEWQPLGGNGVAARIKWRVTWRQPECDAAQFTAALMSHNYDAEFTIDTDNYTVVRVSGYIEIPMTRETVDSVEIPDSVDVYRERVESRVPLGFQRTERSFRVSKDKRRLDYRYTDTELPVALPDKITKIEATQSLTSSMRERAFVSWIVRIDATITPGRGYAASEAYTAWWRLINTRLATVIPRGGQQNQPVLIPQNYTVEEQIFGKSSRFSIVLHYIQPAPLNHIFHNCGMWLPSGTAHNTWQASMDRIGALGVRGHARASINPADDKIVTLCVDEEDIRVLRAGGREIRVAAGEADDRVVLRNLRPANSWVNYEAYVNYVEDSNEVRHKPLPPEVRRQPAGGGGNNNSTIEWDFGNSRGDDWRRVAAATGGPSASGPQGDLPEDVFQTATSPTRYIVLTGGAVRIRHRIPPPRLQSVGGVPTVELRRDFEEVPIANYNGLVFFQATWQITYALGKAFETTIPYSPNPVLQSNGGGGS